MNKLVWIFDKFLEVGVGMLVCIATMVGFAEVISRYVLGASLGWSFEFLQIVLVYITFFGGFLATRQGSHLRVTVVVEAMPKPLRTVCFLLSQIGIGITTVVMTVWGWDYAFRFSDTTTDMLRIPVSYLYIAVPIIGFAMTCQVVADIVIGMRKAIFTGEAETFDFALPGFGDDMPQQGGKST